MKACFDSLAMLCLDRSSFTRLLIYVATLKTILMHSRHPAIVAQTGQGPVVEMPVA